jgi:arsenical pump membrane protein
VELLVFLRFFAGDLAGRADAEHVPQRAVPTFALVVLGVVLLGFGLTSLAGLPPVLVAAAGAVVLGVRGLVRGTTTVRAIGSEAAPLFLLFVVGLAIVVQAVAGHGLGRVLAHLFPDHPTLLGLLGTAALAAVLANLVNNLPATLVLLAALGAHPQPGIVLAVLLGVNLGPNATYLGSLATLLWRRVVAARGAAPAPGEFLLLGLATVPVSLVAAVVALWFALRV